MRVIICGKRWDLRFANLSNVRGDCDRPDIRNKQIRVASSLKDEERLEVIIHECLHAADWRASEEHVTEAAHDIAKILWRLGYRPNSDVNS